MKKRFSSAAISLLLAFALVIGSFMIVAPAEAYALPYGVTMAEVEKEAEALRNWDFSLVQTMVLNWKTKL